MADDGQRREAEHLDLAGVSPQKLQALDTHSPEGKKKSKGIMKFFGRYFLFLINVYALCIQ